MSWPGHANNRPPPAAAAAAASLDHNFTGTSSTSAAASLSPTESASTSAATHAAVPIAPTEPTPPSEPEEPEEPTLPAESAGPTPPSEPAGPTPPARPARPTTPAAPTPPPPPAAPTPPPAPAGPTPPAEPAEATLSSGPAEATLPSGPAEPEEPTVPAAPTDPAEPTQRSSEALASASSTDPATAIPAAASHQESPSRRHRGPNYQQHFRERFPSSHRGGGSCSGPDSDPCSAAASSYQPQRLVHSRRHHRGGAVDCRSCDREHHRNHSRNGSAASTTASFCSEHATGDASPPSRSLSPQSLPHFRSDDVYTRIEIIGKGTYGSVFKARSPDGELVALKKVRMDSENQGFPITAIREIKILQTLKHKNIVQLNDVVASEGAWCNRSGSSVYMVFPFMDHDLTGLLENPQARFSTAQIKYYLMHILEGVHYCHKRRILHRDIKGPNVLISNKGEVKLADFGLARFVSDEEEQYTSNVVTLWYRPPELLFGAKKYSDAIDMWSVGCVFAEMLTAAPAFPGATEIDQIERIFKVMGSPTSETWPDFAKLPGAQRIRLKAQYKSTFQQRFAKFGDLALDLLRRLLQLDPAKRISAADALNHRYFWTEPRPIDPTNLPKYDQSHEYQARKRKQERYEAQQHQQRRQRQRHQQRQQLLAPAAASAPAAGQQQHRRSHGGSGTGPHYHRSSSHHHPHQQHPQHHQVMAGKRPRYEHSRAGPAGGHAGYAGHGGHPGYAHRPRSRQLYSSHNQPPPHAAHHRQQYQHRSGHNPSPPPPSEPASRASSVAPASSAAAAAAAAQRRHLHQPRHSAASSSPTPPPPPPPPLPPHPDTHL